MCTCMAKNIKPVMLHYKHVSEESVFGILFWLNTNDINIVSTSISGPVIPNRWSIRLFKRSNETSFRENGILPIKELLLKILSEPFLSFTFLSFSAIGITAFVFRAILSNSQG